MNGSLLAPDPIPFWPPDPEPFWGTIEEIDDPSPDVTVDSDDRIAAELGTVADDDDAAAKEVDNDDDDEEDAELLLLLLLLFGLW